MRRGKVALRMLLAAGICVAVALCFVGVAQEAATATGNADTCTLAVQSSPISGVAISGTHPGLSNYAVSDGNSAAANLTAPESMTVTSPNGGEEWQRGTVRTVTWTWTGDPGPNVKIALFKGGLWQAMISSSTPNDGAFSASIPCTVVPGLDYKVKITVTANPTVQDYSDGVFDIMSFRVTSPWSGASWKRGTTHSITWTSKCSPGPNVKLALYKGGVWVKMITSSTPNDGSYSWAIPASTASGSDYKVQVTSLSNGADRAACRAFSITQ